MPDLLFRQHQQASLEIADFLRDSGMEGQELSVAQLGHYRNRRIVRGWRLPVAFPDAVRSVDLLLGKDFPWQAPRVALVDRPDFLTWPHVESDGVLCVLPDSTTINPTQPVPTVKAVLAMAAELVENAASGGLDGDFREEFKSYWDWKCDHRQPPIYSLLKHKKECRHIRLLRGRRFFIVAEDDATIANWLANRFGDFRERQFETVEAVLLWLSEPPVPCEYPANGLDLLTIAGELAVPSMVNPLNMAVELVQGLPNEILVVLGAETSHGHGFVGVSVLRPHPQRFGKSSRRRGADPITKGFRAAHMPSEVLAKRFLSSPTVLRGVERADSAWIHGRDQDSQSHSMQSCRVTVLGCGSIGSPVSIALAQAGVGNLDLVDPESLCWANVGRHPLGAEFVGTNKAIALSQKIRSQLPHMGQLRDHNKSWQDMYLTFRRLKKANFDLFDWGLRRRFIGIRRSGHQVAQEVSFEWQTVRLGRL